MRDSVSLNFAVQARSIKSLSAHQLSLLSLLSFLLQLPFLLQLQFLLQLSLLILRRDTHLEYFVALASQREKALLWPQFIPRGHKKIGASRFIQPARANYRRHSVAQPLQGHYAKTNCLRGYYARRTQASAPPQGAGTSWAIRTDRPQPRLRAGVAEARGEVKIKKKVWYNASKERTEWSPGTLRIGGR